MDKWTNEYNGVFRIGSVDCDEYPKICTEQGVSKFPTFKIYPPIPMPPTEITVFFLLLRMILLSIKFKEWLQNIYTVT